MDNAPSASALALMELLQSIIPRVVVELEKSPVLLDEIDEAVIAYQAWRHQQRKGAHAAVVQEMLDLGSNAAVKPAEEGEGDEPEEVAPEEEVVEPEDLATTTEISDFASAFNSGVTFTSHQEEVTVKVPEAQPAPVNLEELLASLALKVEACRLACRRYNEPGNVQEIDHLTRPLRNKANALHCFLWMANPKAPVPSSPELYTLTAQCYQNTIDALELVDKLMQRDEPEHCDRMEPALYLLAEAQSSVRAALKELGYNSEDDDQLRAYEYLFARGSEFQIFISRHMKLDDPADPEAWQALRDKITELNDAIDQEEMDNKRRKSLMNKIAYKRKQIVDDGDKGQWPSLLQCMDELFGLGLYATDTDLREVILPLLETLPNLDNASSDVMLAFESADKERERMLEDDADDESATLEVLPPHVQDARGLLAGKRVLMICGYTRPILQAKIQEELGLAHLEWPDLPPHSPTERIQTLATKDRYDVILLAIRFSSHAYGPDLRAVYGRALWPGAVCYGYGLTGGDLTASGDVAELR